MKNTIFDDDLKNLLEANIDDSYCLIDFKNIDKSNRIFKANLPGGNI